MRILRHLMSGCAGVLFGCQQSTAAQVFQEVPQAESVEVAYGEVRLVANSAEEQQAQAYLNAWRAFPVAQQSAYVDALLAIEMTVPARKALLWELAIGALSGSLESVQALALMPQDNLQENNSLIPWLGAVASMPASEMAEALLTQLPDSNEMQRRHITLALGRVRCERSHQWLLSQAMSSTSALHMQLAREALAVFWGTGQLADEAFIEGLQSANLSQADFEKGEHAWQVRTEQALEQTRARYWQSVRARYREMAPESRLLLLVSLLQDPGAWGSRRLGLELAVLRMESGDDMGFDVFRQELYACLTDHLATTRSQAASLLVDLQDEAGISLLIDRALRGAESSVIVLSHTLRAVRQNPQPEAIDWVMDIFESQADLSQDAADALQVYMAQDILTEAQRTRLRRHLYNTFLQELPPPSFVRLYGELLSEDDIGWSLMEEWRRSDDAAVRLAVLESWVACGRSLGPVMDALGDTTLRAPMLQAIVSYGSAELASRMPEYYQAGDESYRAATIALAGRCDAEQVAILISGLRTQEASVLLLDQCLTAHIEQAPSDTAFVLRARLRYESGDLVLALADALMVDSGYASYGAMQQMAWEIYLQQGKVASALLLLDGLRQDGHLTEAQAQLWVTQALEREELDEELRLILQSWGNNTSDDLPEENAANGNVPSGL